MNYKVKQSLKQKQKLQQSRRGCWGINSVPLLKIMEQLKEDNMKRLKVIKRSFVSYIWLHSTLRIKKGPIGEYFSIFRQEPP